MRKEVKMPGWQRIIRNLNLPKLKGRCLEIHDTKITKKTKDHKESLCNSVSPLWPLCNGFEISYYAVRDIVIS